MLFEVDYQDYILHAHLPFFVAAAQSFNCHILVRKTGRASLSWVGKRGYTGKRADMKAKTADRNTGLHPIAGLVCSPLLRPESFSGERLALAFATWNDKSSHVTELISVPNGRKGFDHERPPRGYTTPYVLQTDPDHRHYGCVALIEAGLLTPRYIHGDYDLYAIVPAGAAFDPVVASKLAHKNSMGPTMTPQSMSLGQQLNRPATADLTGPLSFRVASYINVAISGNNPDLLGALMVNHGEAVNIGKKGATDEPVLAIMPRLVHGKAWCILETKEDHEKFYREA